MSLWFVQYVIFVNKKLDRYKVGNRFKWKTLVIALILFALRYTQSLEPHPGPCVLENEIQLFSVNPMYVKPHIVQMLTWKPHILALQETRAGKMVQIEVEHITKPCGFDCAWSNPTFANSS